MRNSLKRTLLASVSAGAMLVSLTGTAGAWGSYGGGDFDGGGQRGDAASYINPDTGLASANPDVKADSDCYDPDQYDRQQLSDNMANRNVHNDACFLDDRGNMVDGPASFQSEGVGFIAACPDPDMTSTTNGPKTAKLSDTDGDNKNDLCFQSGYQEKGIAGDEEFHARMNNFDEPGTQYVTWCSDPDMNGCDDERNKDSIRIDWSADGTASFSNDDRDRDSRYSW